jgi:uracil-DNA glycosylase family 4
LNKVIFINQEDENFIEKKKFALEQKDCKLFVSNFDYLTIQKQNKLLRETYPISLSYYKHNYLPYFDRKNDINEAFDRIKNLWRDDCEYKKTCSVFWGPTRSSGNIFPKYMIVGLNPGIGDYLKTGDWGTFLSGYGPSTVTLRDALHSLGILDQCWLTNLVRCATDKNSSPSISDAIRCFDNWLSEEIKILKPEVIFTLGKDATSLASNCMLYTIGIKHPAFYVRQGLREEYYKEFEKFI